MFICDWGPRVPVLIEIWGPGSLISYENGDPGSPKWGVPIFTRHRPPRLPPQCNDDYSSRWLIAHVALCPDSPTQFFVGRAGVRD